MPRVSRTAGREWEVIRMAKATSGSYRREEEGQQSLPLQQERSSVSYFKEPLHVTVHIIRGF